MRTLGALVLLVSVAVSAGPASAQPAVQEDAVPAGARPPDVAPAVDGGVWFTAQAAGYLGWLDPATGEVRQIALGPHSAPHGVIVGPDGAPWVTDGGQNAIVRVDPRTSEARLFPLTGRNANLNTAAFGRNGSLGVTGRSGGYGREHSPTREPAPFDARRGGGAPADTHSPGDRTHVHEL